jgi:hypothetical protein
MLVLMGFIMRFLGSSFYSVVSGIIITKLGRLFAYRLEAAIIGRHKLPIKAIRWRAIFIVKWFLKSGFHTATGFPNLTFSTPIYDRRRLTRATTAAIAKMTKAEV